MFSIQIDFFIQNMSQTILDKLEMLAEKEFLAKSKNNLKEDDDFAIPSVESMIPSLLKQEHHNYIIIDSSGVTIKTDKGIETLWPFPISDPGKAEVYKKWSDYLNKRLLPLDVGKELVKFSKNSVKLNYDDYYIAEWKDIQFADDTECFYFVPGNLNKNDANLERQTISKFILVKSEDPERKLGCISVKTERLFPGQCSCLHPALPGVHIESIFDNKNSCSNNNSTQNKQHEASNCSEKSLENEQDNLKNLCSHCQMALYLANRKIFCTKKSELSKMRNVETFTFKYCCETKNERVIILFVAKTQTDNFCIAQIEEDLTYCFNKAAVEVEKQNDVDRIIHSVYHKCLNECSGEIAVFHKCNFGAVQKIFSIAFTKEAEQEKENPDVSLIHVSHIEVPENSLQRKYVVSRDNKSRCVPYEKVYGWFEAKKKYNVSIETDIVPSRKRRKYIWLDCGDILNDVINEFKRQKNIGEENSEESNKKIRPEITTVANMEISDMRSVDGCNNEGEGSFRNASKQFINPFDYFEEGMLMDLIMEHLPENITNSNHENEEMIMDLTVEESPGNKTNSNHENEVLDLTVEESPGNKTNSNHENEVLDLTVEESPGNKTNSNHENEEMIVDLTVEESPGNKTNSTIDIGGDISWNFGNDISTISSLYPIDILFDPVSIKEEKEDDFFGFGACQNIMNHTIAHRNTYCEVTKARAGSETDRTTAYRNTTSEDTEATAETDKNLGYIDEMLKML